MCQNIWTRTSQYYLYHRQAQTDLMGEWCWLSGGLCWCCGSVETKWPSQPSIPVCFWRDAGRTHLLAKDAIFLQPRLSEPSNPPQNLQLYFPLLLLPPPPPLSASTPLPCTDLAPSLSLEAVPFSFTQELSRPSRCRKCLLFNQERIIFLIKCRK